MNKSEKIETCTSRGLYKVPRLLYSTAASAMRIRRMASRIRYRINASGKIQVLLTTPHTLAESVSLHSVCHDAIYFEYSAFDTTGQWHKITPSQELSDLLPADLKEHSGT